MKNKTGCIANCEHKVNFYNPEIQEKMEYLTNLICSYHTIYFDYRTIKFHQELAEKIVDIISDEKLQDRLKEEKLKGIKSIEDIPADIYG